MAISASFRTFLMTLNLFDNLESLNQFTIKNINAVTKTVFDLDVSGDMSKQLTFLVLDSLCTNEQRRPIVEKFRRAIVCTILCDFLKKHSDMRYMLCNDENIKFFINFLYKHTQIAESNYHELYALTEQFGVGSFPFSSLLNHSCAPNVFRLTFDGSNYIVASREISKGEQIFDNYGYEIPWK